LLFDHAPQISLATSFAWLTFTFMGDSPDAGYIYILQNDSLEPDRLKIGRTHHHPKLRAKELSQATGIPTPFTVAWCGHTEDCKKAESLVHNALSTHRTNPKREFFDVELEDAILAAEEAVKLSGRRLNWFYRPEEQWNLDPNSSLGLAGFFFHRILRPLARAPVNLIILILILVWLSIKAIFCITAASLSLLWRIAGKANPLRK